MDCIFVRGGYKLSGSVEIEGAKNAALPMLAATLLADSGQSILRNVPMVTDVFLMCELLRKLHAKVFIDRDKNVVRVDASKDLNVEALHEHASKIRASVVVMGPLLARNGRARVAVPGGCNIGTRPIDLHLQGFKALGATIEQHDSFIEAFAHQLIGAEINLKFPSVGATQNIIMVAVKAKGTTIIRNAAREPEIVNMVDFLNKMGANIHGAGTEVITIKGVEQIHATDHVVIQDRIEAGTFMIATALTTGNVLIMDAIAEHNKPLISKLREMGVSVEEELNGIRVIGANVLSSTDIKTSPHPGFPTDLQAPMTALLLQANGVSTVMETLFEDRFQHLQELRRMNAQVKIYDNVAYLYGSAELLGAEVSSSDLRAAAALILAGLTAKGVTKITNLQYLDRGYYNFHQKLQWLGAAIDRITYDENKTVNIKDVASFSSFLEHDSFYVVPNTQVNDIV